MVHAIIRARGVGEGELGRDGRRPAGPGNYTQAQFRRRSRILRAGGLSRRQIRILDLDGIADRPAPDRDPEHGYLLYAFYPPEFFGRASDTPGHRAIGVQRSGAESALFIHNGSDPVSEPVVEGLIRGGFPTEIAAIWPSPSEQTIFRLRIPRAQVTAAATEMASMIGRMGTYDILTNSCGSVCLEVMRAAGLSPPVWTGPLDRIAEAHYAVMRWFVESGAEPVARLAPTP